MDRRAVIIMGGAKPDMILVFFAFRCPAKSSNNRLYNNLSVIIPVFLPDISFQFFFRGCLIVFLFLYCKSKI